MLAGRSPEGHSNGWTKAKERTLASPFGLRFAHCMAHASNRRLSSVDYQLASIPLLTGSSPTHWLAGHECMDIKKTRGIPNFQNAYDPVVRLGL
jgi:hypothetical protein